MKIAGAVLAVAVLAGIYLSWGLSWPAVLAAGLIGVVLSQAIHATGWREVLTTAGSICLFVAFIGAVVLLILLFMSPEPGTTGS